MASVLTLPQSLKETKTLRADTKRKITNLVKEGNLLLTGGDGLPKSEYQQVADRIRAQLNNIEQINDHVIKLKRESLKPQDYASEGELEEEEEKIAESEDKYLEAVSDSTLPVIRDLRKMVQSIKVSLPETDSQSKTLSDKAQNTSMRMQKLKFPTFTGDPRDYKRFKEHFIHFTKHLETTERFYQLVESMEKEREKGKIKACINIDRAWEVLDEAYGDEDRLVEILLNDLERMHGYEYNGKIDLRKMETFLESLQNFSTQFESLGLKRDLNSRMLLSQVRRKLPEEHRIKFLQSINDGKSTESLPSLVKWLHSLLILLQKAKGPTEHNAPAGNKPTAKNAGHSTMSPGKKETGPNKGNTSSGTPPKCPLYPKNTNNYRKGCYKFRTLPQTEKFNIMNANGICHRCGHNNCKAGKRPYNHEECEFIRDCQIPTCGRNTHFSSICPCVYGLEGYRHFDRRHFSPTSSTGTPANSIEITTPKTLDPGTPQFIPRESNANSASQKKSNPEDKNHITCALPTVMGYLRYGTKRKSVRILLDTGSQISLLREGIIPKSGNDRMQDFSLTTVGGDTVDCNLRVGDSTLESIDGSFSRKIHLTEMRKPCGNVSVITNSQIRQYPHLDGIEIAEAPDNKIDVLLGIENADVLTSDQRVLGPSSKDPVAVKCPLGWYIQGGQRTNDVITNAIVHFIQVAATGEIEEFLAIERAGLEPKRCKCDMQAENNRATETMKQSLTKLEDGAYQINLPWKKMPTDLPNNYEYALKQFLNLERQFKNKSQEWDTYCKQMDDQLKRGVAREISQSELDQDLNDEKGMWFLPHFAVVKDSNTTPVRVVYDAKARYKGYSLNDYLAKGDNMN